MVVEHWTMDETLESAKYHSRTECSLTNLSLSSTVELFPVRPVERVPTQVELVVLELSVWWSHWLMTFVLLRVVVVPMNVEDNVRVGPLVDLIQCVDSYRRFDSNEFDGDASVWTSVQSVSVVRAISPLLMAKIILKVPSWRNWLLRVDVVPNGNRFMRWIDRNSSEKEGKKKISR